MKKFLLILALHGIMCVVSAQKQYAKESILSNGQWVKISVDKTGIYKIDVSMMQSMGFIGKINSEGIRLFGNGGEVLPESNKMIFSDDLIENSISVIDGGDGFFDGNDYILFYACGPNHWKFDSSASKFNYSKNYYSTSSYYYVTTGNSKGKRISTANAPLSANRIVDEFDEHIHHELDSINFLKSGKEWYGEEFNEQAGVTQKNFNYSFNGLNKSRSFSFYSEVIGRSASTPNKINVLINGQPLFEHTTQPLIGTLIEQVANSSKLYGSGVFNLNKLDISYRFTPGSVNAKAWLNSFDLFFRRPLDMQGLTQLSFRDLPSIDKYSTATFNIKNPSQSIAVWQVTNLDEPISIKLNISNDVASFAASVDNFHEYIAFSPSAFMLPKIVGNVKNQNLHSLPSTDFLIITDASLIGQAERLAAFHQSHDNLKATVVEVGQIYNEFSSGSPDPSAIRNFVKMFYDRAGTNLSMRPCYLLFFGAASYILKETGLKITNKLPSYQSESSLDPLTSYVTDDYFGFLDDEEDINKTIILPKLDIGIGRIPARTLEQAKIAVDKILSYHFPESLGAWRNKITLVADDEDYNIHFNDAEYHSLMINEKAPALNIKKLYLDAFPQESGTGGSRYPEVNTAINQTIDKGTLIWNYAGHGGSIRLAQEVILDKKMIGTWKNEKKLPLFITATCDFAPFDDPSQFSIGEELLVGQPTGAIGLLTTTRLVFASSNKIINSNYFRFALQRNTVGLFPTLGESLLASKNYTVSTSGDYINARKFILLGDPAMKIALPAYRVTTKSINGNPLNPNSDTLKGLSKYVFSGEILSPQGDLAADFNGYVYPVLYDKKAPLKTLANDPLSTVANFTTQEHMLYNGKVKAENGKFTFSCIIPKDINLAYGAGKLSYYAENGQYDASGAEEGFQIGGMGNEAPNDGAGPLLNCFLNDSSFKNGSLVGESPTLVLRISDSSNINISGIGIGHDITAVLDENYRQTFFLNDFFEPELNGFLKGTVKFQLPNMVEGNHQLVLRAWDVFNNSGQCKVDFKVVYQKNTDVVTLKNYPNPVTAETVFMFQLAGLTGIVDVEIQVLTMQGQIVKKINKTINSTPNRFIEVVWNGRDENDNKPQSGMYSYRLLVRNAAGQTTQKVQKLIIL
jgi:hypothetical protein